MRQFSDESSYDNGSSTGAFFTGLFAGAVIGAGLGLWFAPKAGSEIREQFSGTARDMGQRVGKTVSDLADRGREVIDRARDVMNTAGEQASQVANEASKAAGNVATAVRRGSQTTMSAAERS